MTCACCDDAAPDPRCGDLCRDCARPETCDCGATLAGHVIEAWHPGDADPQCDRCEQVDADCLAWDRWLANAQAAAEAVSGPLRWSGSAVSRSLYATLPDGRRLRLSDHAQGAGHADHGRADVSILLGADPDRITAALRGQGA